MIDILLAQVVLRGGCLDRWDVRIVLLLILLLIEPIDTDQIVLTQLVYFFVALSSNLLILLIIGPKLAIIYLVRHSLDRARVIIVAPLRLSFS